MSKQASKPKISKIFRLDPKLVARLEREAAKTGRTQTAILEAALNDRLALKRGAVA